jgi:hypothetical protein
MQLPANVDPAKIERLAHHWRHGAAMYAAALDTGLPIQTVSQLFALWDLVRHEQKKNPPRRKGAVTTR